jgi:hypothetical protein
MATVVGVLLVVLSGRCLAERRYTKWSDASTLARKSKRIVLCMFRPNDLEAGKRTCSDYAIKRTRWQLLVTLRAAEIRTIRKRQFVVLWSMVGDAQGNWEHFSKHVRGERGGCLLATAQGEFLSTVPVSASEEKLRECLTTAWDKVTAQAEARAKVARAEAAKRRAVKELTDEAKRDIAAWFYGAALAKLDEALALVEKAEWPEAKQARRVRDRLLERATLQMKSADAGVREGNVVQAMRTLDEVSHLYVGLPAGDKARDELESLMGDPKQAAATAEYTPERRVYDLYDEGLTLQTEGNLKAAMAKFNEIRTSYADSPVVMRADRRRAECRRDLLKKAKKAQKPS